MSAFVSKWDMAESKANYYLLRAQKLDFEPW